MSLKKMLGGAALIVLFGAFLTGCSNSTTPPPSGDSHTFNSTSVNSHTHSVTLDKADVQSPPMAGITETTSSNSAHTHSIAMSQAELNTVNGGGTVTVTTGNSDVTGAHTHQFTITKWF